MEKTVTQPNPPPVQGRIVDRFWDFFCSLKLAITTLILLALTSIIGTVIEQGMTPEELAEKSGWNLNTLKFLDKSINAFDMYHSWWFLALMGLFAVNLICCSIKRFPLVWKAVREPRLVADDGFFRTLSNVEEVVISQSTLDEVRDKVAALLGSRFATPRITEQDGKVYLYAEKGAVSRFGVYIIHAGLIIIFTGGIPLDEFKTDRPREYAELVASGKLEERLMPAPDPRAAARTLRLLMRSTTSATVRK